jgi:rod shape-determining protein MreC
MENFIGRYRNLTILAVLLFGQILGLAVQVKRSTENAPTRLIRIWAVMAVTPLEKGIVDLQGGAGNLWHNYFYLRGVRQENRDLKLKIQQMEIEQVRLNQDAEQAHRLQALLGFKEQFISQTMAAQVIGSSGTDQSRSIYIDKGSRDGVRTDMAVITADGIVGKVLRTFKTTSQVLLINDQTSGVGSILEKSRLQGVLRGTPMGEVVLEKVMSDETVEPGEKVLTSGGDEIFPKGLAVGTVTKVSPGPDLFLNIRVKPATDLNRMEEVLVITQYKETEPVVSDAEHMRAADILAQRLPSVPPKPVVVGPKPSTTTGATGTASSAAPAGSKPAATTQAQSGPSKPQISPAGTKPGMAAMSKSVDNASNANAQKPAAVPRPKNVPATINGGQPSAPASAPPPAAQPATNVPPLQNSTPPQDQPQ